MLDSKIDYQDSSFLDAVGNTPLVKWESRFALMCQQPLFYS